MNDRELLELAAKAAGCKRIEYRGDVPYISMGYLPTDDWAAWNPLISDGDALRLAVKLHLNISTPAKMNRAYVQSQDMKHGVSENCGVDGLDESDSFAATRRAIVRAAAEIGKQLGERP